MKTGYFHSRLTRECPDADVKFETLPMSTKVPIGILGATGIVGQRFVQMLEHHPWFEVAWLAASDRSEGRSYGEAARWRPETAIPYRGAGQAGSCAQGDLRRARREYRGRDGTGVRRRGMRGGFEFQRVAHGERC